MNHKKRGNGGNLAITSEDRHCESALNFPSKSTSSPLSIVRSLFYNINQVGGAIAKQKFEVDLKSIVPGVCGGNKVPITPNLPLSWCLSGFSSSLSFHWRGRSNFTVKQSNSISAMGMGNLTLSYSVVTLNLVLNAKRGKSP